MQTQVQGRGRGQEQLLPPQWPLESARVQLMVLRQPLTPLLAQARVQLQPPQPQRRLEQECWPCEVWREGRSLLLLLLLLGLLLGLE